MSGGKVVDSVDIAIKDLTEARSLVYRAMNQMSELSSGHLDHDMKQAFNQVDLILEQLARARAALDGAGL